MHPSAFKDLTEAVRSRGDIVQLVSEYVALKPAGVRLKGLCPFHQEKTPSFSVDPKNQLFYCFGCHTGGDLFKFVQLYEKVEFREAVEVLAQKLGVHVTASIGGGSDAPQQRILRVNDATAAFYAARLANGDPGAPARAYLERRGLGRETVARLGIGYAPGGWEALRGHLLGQRFEVADLQAAGLVVPRKDGRGEYDRFRDRLMFPIRDLNGKTVAFGGRSLDGAEPKYINSPETSAYVKGSHLYGLDHGREAIRSEGFAIVVEGYMDLAALVQAGFRNVVASLGTAFTAEQARLLVRFTDRVLVSYDGDAAGTSATARTLDLLLEKGLKVGVIELPEGLDPDDFLRKEGAESYKRRVAQAPGYLEFLVHREARSRDLSRVEEKVAAINTLLPHVSRLGTVVERATWAGRIADELRIDDDLVLQELRSALKTGKPRIRQRAPVEEPLRAAEAQLVARLLAGDAPLLELAGIGLEPADLEGTKIADIVRAIVRLKGEGATADYPRVLDVLEQEESRQILTRIAFLGSEDSTAPCADLAECVHVLRRERLVRERRELQREIERTDTDPAALDTLLARKQQLGKQIDALS